MALNRDALIEMREQDEQNGIDPQAFPRAEPPPMPPPPPALQIERPDWEAERIEQHRREQASRPVREPDPAIHVEDVETAPAKPKQKSKTPRLDKVRAWLREPPPDNPRSAA